MKKLLRLLFAVVAICFPATASAALTPADLEGMLVLMSQSETIHNTRQVLFLIAVSSVSTTPARCISRTSWVHITCPANSRR